MPTRMELREQRALRSLRGTTDPTRRRQVIQRLVQQRTEFRHLQDVKRRLALKPRRSLRIQWKKDNAAAIRDSGGPWYTLILFGEEDYWANGGPSPAGHSIVFYPSHLPAPNTNST